MKISFSKLILALFLSFTTLFSYSQEGHNYQYVLNQVLINNEGIKASKFKYEADLKNNRSNVFDDPISVNYNLEPSDHEYNVKQGFYFPTVYAQKNRYSKELSSRSELDMLLTLRDVVYQLNMTFIETLFYIKMKRFKEELYEFTDGLLDNTDSLKLIADSPIRLKRINLAILDFRTKRDNILRELEIKKGQLRELNGGKEIEVVVGNVSHIPIPTGEYDTQAIVKGSLELKIADLNYDIRKRELSLSNQNWIPKLSLGYTVTDYLDQTPATHKLSAGITVPVWNNAAKVSAAKLNLLSSNHLKNATQIALTNKMDALIIRYKSYRELLEDYETFFPKNYLVELKSLLDSGSLDVFSFFQEIASYQEAYFYYCSVEKELFLIINEIAKYKYPN